MPNNISMEIPASQQSLWIFGYGSLVWKPNFEFTSSKVGFIPGYSRKFWQGDTFHRGSPQMPGRVVTLQEDYSECTWGIAYEVRGKQIESSLQHLDVRESVLGGYITKLVKFYPQDEGEEGVILALVYIATPQNPRYLGPATEEEIAAQILACSGCAGHNIEYLLRLAEFMHNCCPDAEDKHLFLIEEVLIAFLSSAKKVLDKRGHHDRIDALKPSVSLKDLSVVQMRQLLTYQDHNRY